MLYLELWSGVFVFGLVFIFFQFRILFYSNGVMYILGGIYYLIKIFQKYLKRLIKFS